MQLVFSNSLLLLFVLSCTSTFGQSIRSHEQVGEPFGLRQFSKEELPNQNQNWSITQDKRGLIYVANHEGVLEYDGNEWRLIKVADNNTAFAVTAGLDGILYVGSRNDFGYLAPDSSGTLVYRSLLDHVATRDLGFGIIWGISVTSEGIYFQANTRLFRWDGARMMSWESEERFHTSFAIHNRFYVKRDKIGLLAMDSDSLRLIPDGEQFADKRVFLMAPEEDEAFLLAAQKDMEGPLELFRFDGVALRRIDVDRHLLNDHFGYTFYKGSVLPEGQLALATLYDGVFIIDRNGRLIETLDEDRRVDQDVNFTFTDAQGGLWLAHNLSGVTYIGSPYSLSEYGDKEGLAGAVNAVLRHKGRLYVASDNGLFRLRDRLKPDGGDDINHFDQVEVSENANGLYWSLMPYNEELLIAAEHGVLSIEEDDARFIGFKPPDKPGVLYRSRFYKGRVYVGLETGLGVLTQTSQGWKAEKLGSVDLKINSFAEASDGSLWFSTRSPGAIWRARFDAEGQLVGEEQIMESEALGVTALKVEEFEGEIRFVAAPKGVYYPRARVAQAGYDIVLDERFPHAPVNEPGSNNVDENQIIDIVKVNDTEYWTLYKYRLEAALITGVGHVRTALPAEFMLPAFEQFREIYKEDNGVTWISNTGFRPLLKYAPSMVSHGLMDADHPPLIRSLAIMGADSVLYGGAFSAASARSKFQKGKILSLDLLHEDNDLRFEYAMPNFNKQDRVEYRYFLAGHDEKWSKWTEDYAVVYRNIEPGSLRFDVQARVGGIPVDGVASVSLTIRSPWFWSWWMKLFYLMFLGYSVYQFVHYQRAKKQIILLNIERELNARLQLANTQLRTANDSLEKANRMKDEFLANASHELRTPLTAILGFTSILKEEVPEENLEFLGLINENGKRLLKTINSLLDLAKLRAGMLVMNLERLDIGEKTEEVVELLTQLAKNQNLYLEVDRPDECIKVRLDAHCYERVLYNLIGNAIKFTQEGGVKVKLERIDGHVHVHVSDTGIGIDESFIPLLFDEFKQEPRNDVRTEGSGLGLTITAQLVELLDGHISVKSIKGKGSTFTVSFKVDEVIWNTNGKEEDVLSGKKTHSALPGME